MDLKTYIWLIRGIVLGRVPFNGLWDYIRAERSTKCETVYVLNPSTQEKLYSHIHYPKDITLGKKYPGIVLIPGAINPSSVFDRRGEAAILSAYGFVVIHFDPEGRGNSAGTEDAGGYLHQDGLHAMLKYMVGLPYVDSTKCGIVSYSYGVTFIGGVTRYPGDPKILFWIDWEGPSDRKSIEKPILKLPDRPHLPLHDLSDDEYWIQREPVRFLRELDSFYLRIQSRQDHAQPDNEHCVQCINAATHKKYGGEGKSIWTRVNNADMNPINSIYEYPNEQPNYLSSPVGGWLVPHIVIYIHDIFEISMKGDYETTQKDC